MIRKGPFRLVRFRVETIWLGAPAGIDEEKAFLQDCLRILKSLKGDVVIPATTNTIFRTYPDGAIAAPYGSYLVDLTTPEEDLWRNVERITRQNINRARKTGVRIREGAEDLKSVYALVRETFDRSDLSFMDAESLARYVAGLGEHGKVLVAEHEGQMHSCVVYAFSDACAYAVYGGNAADMTDGANKLLHWEAMCLFKKMGVRTYDFVGARIDPDKNSKAYHINAFKKRMGGVLRQGYIWKCPLRPLGSFAYTLAVRGLRKGDIVDAEYHKLQTEGNGFTAKKHREHTEG
jgi:lipid II:glycine glycyltransferase (peptidoglycan interpeptide bridge formation enzyme)